MGIATRGHQWHGLVRGHTAPRRAQLHLQYWAWLSVVMAFLNSGDNPSASFHLCIVVLTFGEISIACYGGHKVLTYSYAVLF